MAKIVKRRRGTTLEHADFLGAIGEITIDLDKDTVVVHDGDGPPGYALAREDLSNVNLTNLISVNELDLPLGLAGQVLSTDGPAGNLSFITIDVAGSIVGNLGGDIEGTIANAVIKNNAISTIKIANNAIVTAKIPTDAITSDQILANAVGMSELAVNDGDAGQVLQTNGSGLFSFGTVVTEIIVVPVAGQTLFSNLSYNVGRIAVYLNGVKLLNGVDFIANTGTTVVLTQGVQTTDRVEFQIFA